MSEKGLGFLGKDPSGNKKPINTNEAGDLITFDPQAPSAYTALYFELFPDPAFRAFLKDEYEIDSLEKAVNFGIGAGSVDGSIRLDSDSGAGVKDLSGLEYMINVFNSLTILDGDRDFIPRIDQLTRLAVIRIQDVGASDLGDLRYMKDLEQLRVQDNNLASLGDISNLSNLWRIQAQRNNFTKLDLTNTVALETVDIWQNQLESVGVVSNLSLLENYNVNTNNITGSLGDTSALVSLKDQFRVEGNAFTQSNIEEMIDGLNAIRAIIGPNNPDLRFNNNPGSEGAAVSRASEISDLESAGCSVTI